MGVFAHPGRHNLLEAATLAASFVLSRKLLVCGGGTLADPLLKRVFANQAFALCTLAKYQFALRTEFSCCASLILG